MHDALFTDWFDESHDAYREVCRAFTQAEIGVSATTQAHAAHTKHCCVDWVNVFGDLHE